MGAVISKNGQRKPNVLIGMPNRPGEAYTGDMLRALLKAGSTVHCRRYLSHADSLLAKGFNSLWCEALNDRDDGNDLFAMIHSDINPQDGWLDILYAEMRRVGADVISAVVPIKNHLGLTSTGIVDFDAGTMQRFTMTEIADMPQTFDAAGCGHDGKILLVNTGLWLCDMTKPWVEEMYFNISDRIVKSPDGKYRPSCLSEDWFFSIKAASLGAKVFATTAVKLSHTGRFEYPNHVPEGQPPWGIWKTDMDAGRVLNFHDYLPAEEATV